ncbi:PREDICTED: uncharacterized protein LOC106125720 [Papilio xuthus]|uniref:Uncharacterized protein LOC106125720 n=1 Tax=Papilio xuthus TaxID=66420 RepID=A0AAJ6ZSN1_PAPXU|nr:PREDICTED: uncharacterized protein LOC106125720 [Papilio xuthus]XP_013178475.1 PREDICTED: uncharacterized protein LOC106125720 [Papilio xuthus]
MKFGVLALILAVAFAVPVSKDKLIITSETYPEEYIVYSGEYDIVKLVVPLNNLNYGDNADSKYLFFFVEADRDETGKWIDKGLYVFKDGNAKKLLDNGRDVAAAADESNIAFIGAKDGIYLYNDNSVSVEKYGSISDNIVGIEKPTENDIIYILTDNKEVYVVSENGNKKEKINEIINAEQIILDYDNNLYYLDSDKQIFIYNYVGIKKIHGLPEFASNAQLLKPPVTSDGSVPIVVDEKLYLINDNGKAEVFNNIEFGPDGKPSAYAMEAGLMHYYAKDKKIYEFDVLDISIHGIKGLLGRVVNKYLDLGDELVALLGFISLV